MRVVVAFVLISAVAGAQHEGHEGMSMPAAKPAADAAPEHQASGTSINPRSSPMEMIHKKAGAWTLMFHGVAFIADEQQTGRRGADKFFAPNWFMGTASHGAGRGRVEFRSMLSLDPATITNRRYPLLFQTGETAYGKPLVDAQHPHDFIMSIGVNYAHPVGKGSMLQLYYGVIGDPALGPVAFPHRASAFELPQASLGHHWQDSTHIAASVATVAVKHKWLRLEASGFHGAEPDENRWNVDWGPMDAYSGRVSVA